MSSGPVAVALELTTERLRLRQFEESDLEAYARIVGDAETMRWIGDGRPQDREEAWQSLGYVLDHWKTRGYGLWAAEELESGALVGRIGLLQPEGWPGLEVGWLVDRSRWGEGFASEGGAAALAQAFGALRAERVISLIRPDNAASIRVAEKLGERFERRFVFRGHRVSLYAIARAAWQALGGAA